MPDETPVADASPAPEATKPADEKNVPYGRFQEVNETAKTLKAQLEETQRQLREREEADMSAADREKAARARAEEELTSVKAEAETYKRSRLISKAARDAGFTDPDFAAEYLAGKGGIETEGQAAKAVDALAKRVPGLLKQQTAPPQIGQVLKDGQPVDAQNAPLERAKQELNDQMREAVGFSTG